LKNLADYFWEKFPEHPLSAFQGEPTGANQIVSPKQFEEFILPYYIDLNNYVLNKGFERIFCHICGEQNLNLEHWAKIPFGDPGMLSFGHEVDLTKAIEMFGDKHIIMGNVEPRVIQEGTWQEVYELTKQCIEKAKYAPSGYILMSGCDVPVMAPPYNLYMMKKAVMDFGFYD
jgi:uroporphyrinogen decarboxylase